MAASRHVELSKAQTILRSVNGVKGGRQLPWYTPYACEVVLLGLLAWNNVYLPDISHSIYPPTYTYCRVGYDRLTSCTGVVVVREQAIHASDESDHIILTIDALAMWAEPNLVIEPKWWHSRSLWGILVCEYLYDSHAFECLCSYGLTGWLVCLDVVNQLILITLQAFNRVVYHSADILLQAIL